MARPVDTVNELTEALNRGDLETALSLYEPGAVLVVQPGQIARGPVELRAALLRFIDLKPTLQSEVQQVIEAGDVALYAARWSLRGTDPAGQPVAMRGESSDILRRQPNGRWLIAVDNPWGARVLVSR
jgi:ketosteroid isomerase-like protein